MNPHYADDWLTLYGGDCKEVLASLPADSVDCVVTSPPYWGLRDYGTATWEGGDAECDHTPPATGPTQNKGNNGKDAQPWKDRCRKCGATRIDSQLGLERTPEEYVANMVDVFREVRRVLKPSGTCWLNLGDSYAGSGKGGNPEGSAWSGFVGSAGREKAAKASAPYLGLAQKQLVGIPWRVAFALQADGWYLRSDIIWSKPNPMPESVTDRPTKSHEQVFLLAKGQWKSRVVELSDLGSKRRHFGNDFGPDGAYAWASVLGVRLATAILDSAKGQENISLASLDAEVGIDGPDGDDGDAVGGSPEIHRAAELATRLLNADCSTEQFLSELHGLGITLADRHNLLIGGSPTKVPLPPGVYAYGQTSIAIEHPGEVREFDFPHNRIIASAPSTCSYYFDAHAVREPNVSPEQAAHNERYAKVYDAHTTRVLAGEGGQPGNVNNVGIHARGGATAGRNIRSVWTIATRPYPGAHFAVFPPELPERCIKAGSSERGVCPECGAPWERMVGKSRTFESGSGKAGNLPIGKNGPKLQGGGETGDIRRGPVVYTETLGWLPTCGHLYYHPTVRPEIKRRFPPVPAVVLDPFAGSGTVGMVANRLSRRAILIDLNPDYLKQQMTRNAQTPLGLTEGDAA